MPGAALRAVAARTWPAGTEARVLGVMDCSSIGANPLTLTPEAIPIEVEEKWQIKLCATIHQAVDELNKSGLMATGEVVAGKPSYVLVAEADKWRPTPYLSE